MKTNSPYIFLIADDHSIVRNGLAMLIKSTFESVILYQAGTFQEVQTQVASMKIDFLILDISFPEGNSLALLPSLKLAQPDIKVLIFSSFEEEIYGLRYLKAGADGYLSKLASPEDIQYALKKWISKGSYISPKLQEGIYHSVINGNSGNPLDVLSKREKEVALLLVNGNGNLEISNELELQPTTVSTYKNRIFEKLGINNLPALIQIFDLYNDTIEN